MKKLWITMVVVSILVIPVAFIVLGEANDSSLAVTSQAIEKIQHNTETSDDFMIQVLEQERHFVETSFTRVSIIITVVIILFTVLNFRISRNQLIDVEKKMEKKFEKKFNSIEDKILLALAEGFNIQAISIEQQFPPVAAIVIHFNILDRLTECSKENETVQEKIILSLNEIIRLVPKSSVEKIPEGIRKIKIKDVLDKLSKRPYLKEKIEEIKKALKIDY